MKQYILILFLTIILSACEDTNVLLVTDAASDAVKAISLSDEDVSNLARHAAHESDNRHQIASPDSRYDKRLRRLLAGYSERDGYNLNFKVYLTEEVNAFAMADGTVRVYSGLMDLMEDEELLFVIGHEIGHVVKKHSRQKVVMAYASSALRKGLASQNNEIGQIARSIVGAFAHQLTNAQFSQHEERQADQYGARFLEEEGYDRKTAVSALQKLAALSSQYTFLSSHPDPGKRAEILERDGGGDEESGESFLKTVFAHGRQIISGVFSVASALVNWLFSLW